MQRLTVSYFEVATSDCSSSDESPGLNAIRDYRVLSTSQFRDALNFNATSACTANARTHLVQQFREVRDFRFASRVVNYGCAAGESRGHHHVFGAGHRHFIEIDIAANQAPTFWRPRNHIPAFQLHFGAELF